MRENFFEHYIKKGYNKNIQIAFTESKIDSLVIPIFKSMALRAKDF